MNKLFPIFIKPNLLRILIIGGGYVGNEKIQAIFGNCSDADVTLIAPEIREEIVDLSKSHPTLKLIHKKFETTDITQFHIVIAATSIQTLNTEVATCAKNKNILCNVADTPDLCDFYLGSIVQKGDLKIAISTNGKSPTLAKRIKEWLNIIIPDSIQDNLDALNNYREKLRGDFEAKIEQLNSITKDFKPNQNEK